MMPAGHARVEPRLRYAPGHGEDALLRVSRVLRASRGEWLAGRPFCERHHALALEATEVHWSRAGLVETGLLAGFIGLVSWIFGGTPLPTGFDLGIGLAIIPALIFLVFVYRQDRVEPEPLHLVAGVFVLGGLLGWSVVDPLGDWLVGLDSWQHRSEIGSWVASVGVRGTLAVFFAYLAVRYTVYLTDEFDEPVDGIIYITAAMLGLATATNVASSPSTMECFRSPARRRWPARPW